MGLMLSMSCIGTQFIICIYSSEDDLSSDGSDDEGNVLGDSEVTTCIYMLKGDKIDVCNHII